MTDICTEKLGLGGPCTRIKTYQQSGNSVGLFYAAEELTPIQGLCRGAVSGCGHPGGGSCGGYSLHVLSASVLGPRKVLLGISINLRC